MAKMLEAEISAPYNYRDKFYPAAQISLRHGKTR